jgi:tetratricopeptide (TPR) repeat protein
MSLPTASPGGSYSVPPLNSQKPARSRTLLTLLVIVLCLVVIVSLGYWVVYPQISAAQHWKQAQKALENNDLAKAKRHLESCIQGWPTDGEVHFLMARTCRRLSQFDRARDHLQLAAKQHWVIQQIKLENLLIKAQNVYLPETTKQLQELLKEGHQDDTFIFEALIIGCLETNNFFQANRWVTIWIEQHPDDWLARYWLGMVLESAGEYELAVNEYRQAMEMNPTGAGLHLRLAEMLARPNPTEEAMKHYEAALAADPNNPTALLGLARCQHSLATKQVTRATLDRLIELDPQNVPAYCLYGQVEQEEDQQEKALEWLQKAHALDPNHLVTNKNLSLVLNRLNRFEEAKEAERRSEELEKQLGRLEEINRELLERPQDVGLRSEAGKILYQRGEFDKALRWFVSAFLIDPMDKSTKQAMKKCLERMGNSELVERYKKIFEGESSAD